MLRTPMKSVLIPAGLVIASLALAPFTAAAASKPGSPAISPDLPHSPKSVFVVDPTAGRDPFFPKSKRLEIETPKTNDAVVVVQTLFPDDIRCQGFSGSRENRLAIVNNKTFGKGEKNDITLKSGQRVQLRCLEVKEKSVILELNGIIKELGLRPTLQ